MACFALWVCRGACCFFCILPISQRRAWLASNWKPWPVYNLPPISRANVKLSFAQNGGVLGFWGGYIAHCRVSAPPCSPCERHISYRKRGGWNGSWIQGMRRIFRKMLQSIFNIDRVVGEMMQERDRNNHVFDENATTL